jgi:small-conductance mechanosensitive channel
MKEVKKPRVWILGAGFSRHAGGPLLNDLFSEQAEYYFENPQSTHHTGLKKIGRLFREKMFKLNKPATGCFWAHAEEFLEKIDQLAEIGSPKTLIEMFSNHCCEDFLKTSGQLMWYARSRICKEVDDYIHTIPMDSERLQPYIHWVKKLSKDDVVVTFNYDTLIEAVAKIANIELTLIKPNSNWDSFSSRSSPALIKLHGSVDWSMDAGGNFVDRISFDQPPSPDEDTPNFFPMIAAPGASKGRFVKQLNSFWDMAKAAICTAESIHIVGYRFPESDSAAVLGLINTFRDSKATTIDVVLGIDTSRPDVVRVERMVESSSSFGPANRVRVVGLFAQDYLALDSEWTAYEIGPLYIG